MKPLFHPITQKNIEQLLVHPVHAVLLEGSSGSGKETAARYIASQLIKSDQVEHPYIKVLRPINGSIPIELVRELRSFLRLKVPSKHPIARVVIIVQAERLTNEAQNSLLKMLEEPPEDTVLILTTNTKKSLLQTIVSRVRTLTIFPIDQANLEEYFADLGHNSADVSKAFHLSGGLIGLMDGLLNKQNDHELAAAVAEAKSVLKASRLEKLIAVDRLAKQKETLSPFLIGLQKVCQAGLHSASNRGDDTQTKHWQQALKQVILAQEQLQQNASAKLVLTELMLNI